MKLYCVRHGQAEKFPNEKGEQPLTPEGREEIQHLAKHLEKMGIKVSCVLHSGKLRAKETTEILSPSILLKGCKPEIYSLLGTDQPVQSLIDEIQNWQDDMMLVGHMPFISQLVSALVLGNDATQIIRFLPGTVVCLDRYEENRWVIDWAIRAEVI